MTIYKDGRLCSIEGCSRRAASRNWCGTHYARWRKHGDPLLVTHIVGDDEARFWSHVDKNGPGGCWLWTGTLLKASGYPVLTVAGKVVKAHRFSYELVVGPIPKGLTLDHTCHTAALSWCRGGPACLHRRCVNPGHLEPVTAVVNQKRARKPACPYGHAYDEKNTHWVYGKRQCRTCRAAAGRRYRAARRAAA